MSNCQTSFIFSVPFPVQDINHGLYDITLWNAAGHHGSFTNVLKNFGLRGRIWQLYFQIHISMASYLKNTILEKL